MSDRIPLLLATSNRHKTLEFQQMLGDLFLITDLSTLEEIPDIVEDGATFSENAAIKSLTLSRLFPDTWVLSDDSGLEVDALGGEPGVHSARYAGAGATDAMNRQKLLSSMQDVPEGARQGRFRCVLTLSYGGVVRLEVDGSVEGCLATAERGAQGFGYDSLFIPEGHEATFGELPEQAKNELSHRARAVAKLRECWLQMDPQDA